jgi:hydroxymethylpyrimidine/phosphomethylpyrimidine kinase
MRTPPVGLTIAATDSGGGAGVGADLATFAALGVHGACAVTAVTAQDTNGVRAIFRLDADQVWSQLAAVLDDLPVTVAKTGMLATPAIARLIADLDPRVPVVVDPVLVASSGDVLGGEEMVLAYREHVLPRATVVTPNRDEALRLTGADPSATADELAHALHALGPAVVLTGGDRTAARCRDVVVDAAGRLTALEHPGIATRNDHGTGCTFSAALASGIAHGYDLHGAARAAQTHVARALITSKTWRLGRGRGPVSHLITQPAQEI